MTMLSRFATLGGAATDPYWNNVSYLLVGNGANGTTTNIKDSSSNNLATTINGNTVISTAQSKYGSGSVYFDGIGDYLSYSANTVLDFGTGNFTIEGWVYPTSNATDWFFISAIGGGGLFFGSTVLAGATGIGIGRVAVAWDFTSGVFLATNKFSYMVVSRSGNTFRFYVDGASIGTTTISSSYNLSTGGMSVGSQGASYYLTGYIYDLRVTKGIARYTGSTMTVPTGPLPTTGP